MASLTGLTNRFYTPQGEIDQVLANNTSGPSSPAIAHPYNLLYTWTDWTVLRYRGMELMAAFQSNFADTASPMVKWRAELTRLLSNTFTYGYFASSRTGGDYHGGVTGTVPTYVTWLRTGSWSSKSSVDSAIYNGRTVASKMGGLGLSSQAHTRSKSGGTTSRQRFSPTRAHTPEGTPTPRAVTIASRSLAGPTTTTSTSLVPTTSTRAPFSSRTEENDWAVGRSPARPPR